MYRANGFDEECARCNLSCKVAVPGQAEVPLNEVKLIVISAYPGNEEMKKGATLVPSDKEVNAGRYLRLKIKSRFDKNDSIPEAYKPFERYVFFTNALKCPFTPNETIDTAIRSCKHWLDIELDQLPPKAPILIAASQALHSLLGKQSLYKAREKVLRYKDHPCIVTPNPIEGVRYTPKIGPNNVQVPPVVGSIPWKIEKDLIAVAKLVAKYIEEGG